MIHLFNFDLIIVSRYILLARTHARKHARMKMKKERIRGELNRTDTEIPQTEVVTI